MCTPISYRPLGNFRIESASSKSFASTGSMVNVLISRQSLRFAISASSKTTGSSAAASNTSCGKNNGKPACANSSFIAASFSSSGDMIAVTSPTGFLSSLSHFTSFADTLSLFFAPFKYWSGIKISGMGLSVSGTKNANLSES